MATPRFLRAEQILRNLINRTVARSELTDLTDTSSIKHALSAVARTVDEFYFQLANVLDSFDLDAVAGDDLDRRIEQVMGTSGRRRKATKAAGTLVFGRPTTGTIVTIPIGTAVLTDDGVEVVTTATGTIGSGSTSSAPVAALARIAGASGNIDVGTAVKFSARPVGVVTVTNPASFTSGGDRESDDELRARGRDYIASLARSTARALEFAARSVQLSSGQRVVYARCVTDLLRPAYSDLFIDDGTGAASSSVVVVGENLCAGLTGPPSNSAVGGEVTLFTDQAPILRGVGLTLTSSTRGLLTEGVAADFVYDETKGRVRFITALATAEVITADYTYLTGLVAEVQRVINGVDGDDAYPGFKAEGVQVVVRTPGVLLQTIEAGIVVAEGYDFDGTKAAVTTALSDYVNSLSIGEDLLRAELIAVIMGVAGVLNTTLALPAADVAILDDQIARTSSGSIILS